jgi:hypothetical protein
MWTKGTGPDYQSPWGRNTTEPPRTLSELNGFTEASINTKGGRPRPWSTEHIPQLQTTATETSPSHAHLAWQGREKRNDFPRGLATPRSDNNNHVALAITLISTTPSLERHYMRLIIKQTFSIRFAAKEIHIGCFLQ